MVPALFAWAAWRSPPWEAAVLGAGLMVVAAQIPCYYYALLLVYAFLWPQRPSIGVALVALAALSWALAIPLRGRDEIFAAVSLASVLFAVFATVLVVRDGSRPC